MPRRWLGAKRIDLETCASTNDEAARLAAEGAVHGTVVTARRQTAGRGRGGHAWHSPDEDNLYMSAVLRPAVEPKHVPPITLAAGVAVHEAVNEYGVRASLKWPNDVLVGREKLAGILTEMGTRQGATDHVILGIGVNLNTHAFPEELHGLATSLSLLTGGDTVDRGRFVDSLLDHLEVWLDRFFDGGVEAISSPWTERATLAGRRLRAALDGASAVEGVATGLAADGSLLLRDDRGETHRIIAGDLTVLDDEGGDSQ